MPNESSNGFFCKNCGKNITKPFNCSDVELIDSCYHVIIGKQKTIFSKCPTHAEAKHELKKSIEFDPDATIVSGRNLK